MTLRKLDSTIHKRKIESPVQVPGLLDNEKHNENPSGLTTDHSLPQCTKQKGNHWYKYQANAMQILRA